MRSDVKKKIHRRFKIIGGQIKGLQKMVEEEKYCVDIINQSAAAREALSAIENLMLENHLSTHVIDQMKAGKSKKAIKEILEIYKLSKKK